MVGTLRLLLWKMQFQLLLFLITPVEFSVIGLTLVVCEVCVYEVRDAEL